MSAAKKRSNQVGLTSQADMFQVIPNVTPMVLFPDSAVRTRVIVHRPQPEPVRRTCIMCGAAYDDYTKRETLYCRDSCKVKMSETKRDRGIEALARATGAPVEKIWDVYDKRGGGMSNLEKLLNGLSFKWDRTAKQWLKAKE